MFFLRRLGVLLGAALLALSFRPAPSAAAPPHLVKDLDDATLGSGVVLVGVTQNHLFFEADRFLYRTDGTVEGTFPVSNHIPVGERRGITETLGSTLVFVAGAGLVGTDGTVEGTLLLKEGGDGDRGRIAKLGGYVYFSPGADAHQLWRTDGTPAGTSLFRQFGSSAPVTSIHATSDRIYFHATEGELTGLYSSDGGPGPPVFLGSFDVRGAQPAGRRLFFVTEFPTAPALWVTDGSKGGTLRLHELTVFSGSATLGALGDRVLFMGEDSFGREPWISDGTPAGTMRLADAAPGQSSDLRSFETLGSKAYFVNQMGLWETDGTPPGTRRFLEHLNVRSVVSVGQRLLLAGGWSDSAPGPTIWVSDGTSSGTVDVLPERYGQFHAHDALALSGSIYFPYTTPRFGEELWSTDGTPSGTRIVIDVNRNTLSASPYGITAGTTRAFFLSRGVWSTDGTEAGTRRVMLSGGPYQSGFDQLTLLDDVAYHCGTEGVWRIEGPDDVASSLASWPCRWIAHAGGVLYFVLTRPTVFRDSLWRSDGSAQGTLEVREVPSNSFDAVAFLGRVLFTAQGATGREPWISDGTAEGTQLVKDVVAGPGNGVESSFFAGPAFAFFRSGDQGGELWRTDGTGAGTAAVPMGDQVVIAVAGQIGSVLYFFTRTTSVPHEHSLWRTDGTPSGTGAVTTLPDYILTGLKEDPVVSGGRVFFLHGPGGVLWASDGTAAGTRPLTSQPLSGLVAVPGGVAFATFDSFGFSDGTPEGSRILGPVEVRLRRPPAVNVARLGSMLLFAGTDAIHGEELWRADLVEAPRLFYTVEPCRAADTRGTGDGPPMVSESARTFTIAGTCGVPQDASGVLLNVTVVNPTDAGYVGVFAAERQDFDARVTSFPAGTTRASSLILGFVPAGDGQLTVRLRAPGSAHVVLDVSGYFR